MERSSPKLIEKLTAYLPSIGLRDISSEDVTVDERTIEERFVEIFGSKLKELPFPTEPPEPTPPHTVCKRVLNADDLHDSFVFENGVKLKVFELSKDNGVGGSLRTRLHRPQLLDSKCMEVQINKLDNGNMCISVGWKECVCDLGLVEGFTVEFLEFPNGSLSLVKHQDYSTFRFKKMILS